MSRAVVPGRQEGVTVRSGSGLGFVFSKDALTLSYPLQVAPAMGMGLSFPLLEG